MAISAQLEGNGTEVDFEICHVVIQVRLHKQRALERLLRPDAVQMAAGTRRILARRARSTSLHRATAVLSSSLQDAADMGLAVRG